MDLTSIILPLDPLFLLISLISYSLHHDGCMKMNMMPPNITIQTIFGMRIFKNVLWIIAEDAGTSVHFLMEHPVQVLIHSHRQFQKGSQPFQNQLHTATWQQLHPRNLEPNCSEKRTCQISSMRHNERCFAYFHALTTNTGRANT